MLHSVRRSAFACAVVFSGLPSVSLLATAASAAKPLNACTLFTNAEIRQIGGTAAAGVANIDIPPDLEHLGGGGTYCGIGLVDVQLDPVRTSGFSSFKKQATKNATSTKLAGVGDEAYVFVQKDGSASKVYVLLRAGKHVLTLQLAPIGLNEIPAARKSLTALAKAAVPKLKK